MKKDLLNLRACLRASCCTFLFFAAIQPELRGETLPSDRIAPWQDAGLPSGIPQYAVGVNVKDHGATGDGVSDDTKAIQSAIEACPEGQAVFLPDGDYRLTKQLVIDRSIVLRGESMLNTVLKMDHSGNGIFIGTYSGGTKEFTILDGLQKGSTVLELDSISTSKFVPGRTVDIRQDNDPNVYQSGYKGYHSWTDRQTGMINEIVSVEGRTVTLKHPLILDFSADSNPTIRAQGTVFQAGIENLKIDRTLDDQHGTGNNVLLYSALQCWVKDVWSEKTYSHHLRLSRSLQCEIRGNVINDSWRSTGGRGYGITAQDRSTLNLIEDNTANHLRHSYVVQVGASANVFGYNYSRDPYSSVSPKWIFPDLSAHGSMANHTLWEGNKAVQLNFDHVHGSNPWNTAFRNFITKPKERHAGMIIAESSKWCNLIGNIIGTNDSAGEAISIHTAVEPTTITSGNLIGYTDASEAQADCDSVLPDSLYQDEQPSFLEGKPWPFYGPTEGVTATLPAEDRWYSLTGTTPPALPAVATNVSETR